jgi:AraC-like DNA-binding protein
MPQRRFDVGPAGATVVLAMNDITPPPERDVLSEVLHAIRFRGTVLCKSTLRAPWGFAVDRREFASFHYVARGRGWLEVEGTPGQRQIRAGDLVILPHGDRHVVRDTPDTAAVQLEQLATEGAMDAWGNLRAGGGGAHTVLVCGIFRSDEHRANPVLRALPRVVHLQGPHGAGVWLRTALDYLAREAGSRTPGASTVIARLADIVFIEAVRGYFGSSEARRSGLGAALVDPRIGAALAAVHRELDRRWDLGALAKVAAMSRTAFALEFRRLVGEPPLHYVTARRMEKAKTLLRESAATVAEIAESVGYDTEVGFYRAFRRHAHVSPATYRNRARRAA